MNDVINITVKNVVGRTFHLQIKAIDVLTLWELKKLVAAKLSLSINDDQIHRVKLIKQGNLLNDDPSIQQLENGDILLAIITPEPPSQKTRDAVLADAGVELNSDSDDDVLSLQVASTAPPWQRKLLHTLIHTFHIPELLIAIVYRVSWRFWILLALWIMASSFLSQFHLGPVFFVATIFMLMFLNLGARKDGSFSAYSIFNPEVQRLPGQLTAEHMDRQARRGQL